MYKYSDSIPQNYLTESPTRSRVPNVRKRLRLIPLSCYPIFPWQLINIKLTLVGRISPGPELATEWMEKDRVGFEIFSSTLYSTIFQGGIYVK